MDWVKDKMGLRFGCGKILLFLHRAPSSSSSSSSYFYHSPASQRERSIRHTLISSSRELLMKKVEDLEEFVVEGEKGFSECSSECQSGWTLYLCQSQEDSLTTSSPPTRREVSVYEDEEEDLSMRSDASSGPPHAAEKDCINFYYCSNDGDRCLTTFAGNGINKRRKAAEESRQKESSSFLDDTATSSISSSRSNKKILVEDVLELSCGFSANHFKGKASLKKHMGTYRHSSSRLSQAQDCRVEDKNNLP